MSLLSQWQSILSQIHGGCFYDFYTTILKPFCPLKPWNMFEFHQFIIHRVFVSCNQNMIFISKLLSSIFYQENVKIISGQNLAIPVTVIWWNRNRSWKKECQMKFDRQRTPVISGKHDWVQKISEVAFTNVFTSKYLVFPEHNDSIRRGLTVLNFEKLCI